MTSRPTRPNEVRKILAIKLRQLGDTVIMTAALKELHRLFPHAAIHVVVSNPWVPILNHTPGVTRIWPYTRHEDTSSRVKAMARLGYKLRHEKFDLVINFHASPSSSLLAFATGAPIRSVHFHGLKDANRFSTVVIPNKGKVLPIVERDLDAIRALGVKAEPGTLPEIFLQPKEVQRGLQLRGAPGTYLMLGLGASRPTKQWPVENFCEVAAKWCQHFPDGRVLALGSKTESELLLNFTNLAHERTPQFATRIHAQSNLRIRELAAVLKHATVYLGNDSGPKHIAVAVGTPTVTLFGPEHPLEWHPYPRDRHPYFFIEHLPCRRDALPGLPEWCALTYCEQEGHQCMVRLGTEEVFGKCLELAHRAEAERSAR